jgi:hypothetical protein
VYSPTVNFIVASECCSWLCPLEIRRGYTRIARNSDWLTGTMWIFVMGEYGVIWLVFVFHLDITLVGATGQGCSGFAS